ncbi:MAG: radical SAM protein, partial [Candidatus Aminicenantes bacterium]
MNFIQNWIGSERNLLLDRHLHITIRHLTIRKVINIVFTLLDFLFRKRKPNCSPIYIKVEPTRFCHLKCKGCMHNNPEFREVYDINSQLKFEDFKKIIDPLCDNLVGISFSLFGEPLLCDDLLKMIEYSHKRNIGTIFPSNLSVPLSESKAEKIVKSGLDMLMVSLDGVSKKTYNKYRTDGNFDLIIENVKKLSIARKNL